MDLLSIIKGLREERELIEQAILSIERLASQRGQRRGRPPAWMNLLEDVPKKRGRPPKKIRVRNLAPDEG